MDVSDVLNSLMLGYAWSVRILIVAIVLTIFLIITRRRFTLSWFAAFSPILAVMIYFGLVWLRFLIGWQNGF